jgi:thiol reductant ABC exporter CydC subunit
VSALRRVVRAAPPRRGRLALAVALGAGTVLAGAALLATSGALISHAALRPEVLSLFVAIVLVRAFGLARALLRYGERLVSHDLAFRALAELRVRCFRRLAPLVPGDLGGARAGELLSRFVGDVDTLQQLYLRALAPPLVAVVAVLACGAAAALLLPSAGVALVAALLLAATLVPLLTARTAAAGARGQAPARAALTSELVETLAAAPELAVGGHAQERCARLAVADARLARSARADARANALAVTLGALLAGVGTLAVLILGVGAVHAGRLDGVLLAALVLLALAAFEGVAPLAAAGRHLHACAAAAARVEALTERAPTVVDPPAPRALPAHGALELERVGVRLGDGPPLLRDVSLRLAPGERVVLVGASGAGKTTLARLLVRFADPTAGRVTLGGVDLRAATQRDVRDAVLLLAQDARVFASTLRENVLLARRDATDAEIMSALDRAGLGAWLRALPDGLDTFVGEDGSLVSGGERQRIVLARACLSRARFLVLDEPTAQLDAATARAVMRDLDAVAGERGVLLITHDPAAVARADCVHELRDGALR